MTTKLALPIELIPVDVPGEINRLHFENMEAARTTIQRAVRIGELLSLQKAKLKHGEWLPWLTNNVAFSRQTADNYRRIYEHRDKMPTFGNLSDAYRLLNYNQPPELEPTPGIVKRFYAHPVTRWFPEWSGEELQTMADDIAANGLIDPITLFDGCILDGWLRYVACYPAKVPHRFVEYTGNDPMHFVIVRNFSRFKRDVRAMVLVVTAVREFGLKVDQIPVPWINAARFN